MAEERETLSIKDVSEIFNISREFVLHYINIGILEAFWRESDRSKRIYADSVPKLRKHLSGIRGKRK